MKKVCLQCKYWTENKKHGNYKCYAGSCPAKQRDLLERPSAIGFKIEDGVLRQQRLKVEAKAKERWEKLSKKCRHRRRKQGEIWCSVKSDLDRPHYGYYCKYCNCPYV